MVLLDAEASNIDTEQSLNSLACPAVNRRFPIVVISDDGRLVWRVRLNEGEIDDLLPRDMPPLHWRLRLDSVLRTFRQARELEHLRNPGNRATDLSTPPANREMLVSMLFRETDRVHRMKTPLSVMLFGIRQSPQEQPHLSAAEYEYLLKEIVDRVYRLMRSYDFFCRLNTEEFALALPGCTPANAASLAERIRAEILDMSLRGSAQPLLGVDFGIAASHGRSPLVVLREAEHALRNVTAVQVSIPASRPRNS